MATEVDSSAQQHGRKQRGKRKLVEQQVENEYEQQRRQRIERNRQILEELGVDKAAAAVQQAMNKPTKQRACAKPKDGASEAIPVPSRRSSRLAAQPPEAAAAAAAADPSDKPDASSLLSQSEYFKLLGKELTGFEVDGSFHGWVNPSVCDMYGIAGSAAEAWEAHGGGSHSRRPDMSAVPAHLRTKGWSEAKAFAATQLCKNPNAYFYRHVAPHEQQAQGEWTDEEHELFLETARKHGVGDKWGLFASYLPQRVGYQCSAYYRDVMIARGLILDRRFKLTASGSVVFVG